MHHLYSGSILLGLCPLSLPLPPGCIEPCLIVVPNFRTWSFLSNWRTACRTCTCMEPLVYEAGATYCLNASATPQPRLRPSGRRRRPCPPGPAGAPPMQPGRHESVILARQRTPCLVSRQPQTDSSKRLCWLKNDKAVDTAG